MEAMGVIHDGVAERCKRYFERFRRTTHVTPKSYLSFLAGYKNIYTQKVSRLNDLASRMTIGLEKLQEAAESVKQLEKDLEVKRKELAIAAIESEEVLKSATAKAQATEVIKTSVQKKKDEAQKIKDGIQKEKDFAETKLVEAIPLLEQAEAALKTIKPADIGEVKKLANPPIMIQRVMDCVCILFQRPLYPTVYNAEKKLIDASWGEANKLMSGPFLVALQNFDRDTINEEMVELMEGPYISDPSFNKENAAKASQAAVGLLLWVAAMSKFYWINREVLPLKANLVQQEVKLNKANSQLAEAQGVLDEKEAELAVVQAEFAAAMANKKALEDDAAMCERKKNAASQLISMLGGERTRWTEQSKEYRKQIERLVGDVVLCTGFLSYAGPFNQEFRNALLREWEKELLKWKIPFSESLDVTRELVDDATVEEWNIQGLPNDELSVQNGIITTQAARTPLLIDPQQQAKQWIKRRERDTEMVITSLNHKYFRQHMEDALSLGKPLLLEDVEEKLDPALDNILERNYIKQGSSYKVKFGDKEIDVLQKFRMYITTKLPNPCYTPEIFAKTSIVDFTVTVKGLEDQLLGRVILTEKRELESERTKLMEDVAANKRKQYTLEANLLHKLTSIKGSLVDDPTLIDVLKLNKITAAEVGEKLITADETKARINQAREEFRPVACRGSILYFLIVEMSLVNVMYQTSLRQFLNLFDAAMEKSEKSPVTQKRVSSIIEFLTYGVFRAACRGLYETHKFLFTLLLALKIDIQKKRVSFDEFQTFIKGGAALDLNSIQEKKPKWVSDMVWLNLVQLSFLPAFGNILQQVQRNDKEWKTWFDKDAPEDAEIPEGYSTSLDDYRKLLLIRSWVPDRTLSQARKYIADALGERFAEPVILNMEDMWAESDIRTPLVCLLSMGSDPTTSIESLAKKRHISCKAISMGQGQEVHARKLMQQCIQGGGWVLLQNCHLGLEFMVEVVEILSALEDNACDTSFRVWVTTEEHPRFPISMLQLSIKYTNEPPAGMRAGVTRTYGGVSQDMLDIIPTDTWRTMLYGVSFLHSAVQERRKFGPLGWCVPYEFNWADWYASVQFVQAHLDDLDAKAKVNWGTVRYMLGEVQYGGRVTDDYDKRLLNTYAKVWFSEDMFRDNFQFAPGYKIPKVRTISQIMDFMEKLPNVDPPTVFGLHTNADITYQANRVRELLDTVLNIQPKDSSTGGGETRESIVKRQAEEMLSKLPAKYIPSDLKRRLEEMGKNESMNIFLRQEIDRMQKVIVAVKSTLSDLLLAIDGTIVMNENLRDALDNIFDARVPKLWTRISWLSSTLGFWFSELIERNAQYFTWLWQGRPKAFWMTGFFNPQGFLTAMRQEVTRKNKGWSLDYTYLVNEVTHKFRDDIRDGPKDNVGVYVYGLYLDGAGWDRKNCKVQEQKPKVLFEPLPVVYITAANSKEIPLEKDKKIHQYVCPVYKKPRRTDMFYVTALNLRTSQPPEHWILRGVALLCDIK